MLKFASNFDAIAPKNTTASFVDPLFDDYWPLFFIILFYILII
jgi:hypothetical protein